MSETLELDMYDYTIIRKKIPAVVGMMSLIGVRLEYPVGWGNYFNFYEKSQHPLEGLRCINMWAENLKEAKERFLDDDKVEIELISQFERNDHWGVVVDERIPKDWFYPGPYFTGCRGMKDDLIMALKERYDWTQDACNRYIDPDQFHLDRGQLHTDLGNGIQKITFKPTKYELAAKKQELERRKQ